MTASGRSYVLSWHAIWVPKTTPKNVIAKLNAAVVETLADPAVRKRLADVGQEIFPREQQTPEAPYIYEFTGDHSGGRSSGMPTSRRSEGLLHRNRQPRRHVFSFSSRMHS